MKFRDLKFCDVFRYEDGLFMKIKRCTYKARTQTGFLWSGANAINLINSNFEWFNNSNKVELDYHD